MRFISNNKENTEHFQPWALICSDETHCWKREGRRLKCMEKRGGGVGLGLGEVMCVAAKHQKKGKKARWVHSLFSGALFWIAFNKSHSKLHSRWRRPPEPPDTSRVCVCQRVYLIFPPTLKPRNPQVKNSGPKHWKQNLGGSLCCHSWGDIINLGPFYTFLGSSWQTNSALIECEHTGKTARVWKKYWNRGSLSRSN